MRIRNSSIIHRPNVMILGLSLVGQLTAQNPPLPPNFNPTRIGFQLFRNPAKAAQWAGSEGPLLGENLTRSDAFMAARKSDIRAGAKAPWNEWLSGLSASKNKTLKVWALTRLWMTGNGMPTRSHRPVRHMDWIFQEWWISVR